VRGWQELVRVDPSIKKKREEALRVHQDFGTSTGETKKELQAAVRPGRAYHVCPCRGNRLKHRKNGHISIPEGSDFQISHIVKGNRPGDGGRGSQLLEGKITKHGGIRRGR